MAAAYSDPLQSLANNLVGSMSKVAVYQSGKASYDKSFAVTILGINQKFTGDVSDSDKQNLIAKYSIPETTDDGEPKYFTVKINGAYYVILQNASFMLYDKVMAYLPNGDWSRMYLDYQSGGKGDIDVDLPTVYTSPYMQDPADQYTINEGDYWIAINTYNGRDKELEFISRWENGAWNKLCNSKNNLYFTVERAIIVQRDDLV